ncbi:hypothetical protein [Deinococcus hopiensis]|uniref:Uncharacterized protein n=1 Tax=Deinococcus hopiensis KR-140 TaxID=695939 RepID=A0A1W1VHX4_9DEIO|nr:hypothetical protein [Deinococcus hopiensis]SMB92985.1 hypothetical protein SAMN00790413_01789 [Deinococcus hopiensis KR-140]
MPALPLLLPLLLTGGAGRPADLPPELAAAQRWRLQSRAVDGRVEEWTLRLKASVGKAGPSAVRWEATLEGLSLPNASEVWLERGTDLRGRPVLTAFVQSFDGRSQPDLRVCSVVLGPGKAAPPASWKGVYGLGLSGQRQLNAYLAAGPRGDLLGTCRLTWLGP